MKSLAAEILSELLHLMVAFPRGPMARDVATKIAVDVPSVRAAYEKLEADGRARIVRRHRSLHLVPIDYPARLCVICRGEFEAVRKQTKTCSHSCALYLAWQNTDMRKRHRASVKAAKSKPSVRRAASISHKRRCADPKVRAQMSENNRRSWADPVKRTNRIIAIERAWTGPKASGRIAKARKRKLKLWRDPEWKAKTKEAMRTGTRGRFKRAVIALADGNPNMPVEEIAQRVGLSSQQVKIIMRRAWRFGEISRRPEDGRKARQKPEHIRKRVESTRRNMQREGCAA